jgi:uncharacterized membrane protein YdjX (TVP38/TMEM64 family)
VTPRPWPRLALLGAYAAGAPLAVALLGLWFLPDLFAGLRAAGGWAPPLFTLACATGLALALLPANGTAVLAGALFGPAGFVAAVVAYLGACAVVFELVRRYLRPAVQAAVGASPRARAIQARLTPDGWRVVVLARLTPSLSFAFVNLVLAAGPVSRGTYLGGTALGMLPRTAVGVGLGVAAEPAVAALRAGTFPSLLDGPLGWALAATGAASAGLLAALIVRAVRQARRDGAPAVGLDPAA